MAGTPSRRVSGVAVPGCRPGIGIEGERPLYFGATGRSLFGWLHEPRGPNRAAFGVVICNPFGYEASCAHRSIRDMATELAGLGVPVLRFDYSGTGDSEDLDPEQDQLAHWSEDVSAAAAELRRLTQVSRIRLLGVRLGFLVATFAATRCEWVEGLIGVLPVTEGRRYLRELQRMRLATLNSETQRNEGTAGSIEVSGFPLSAATVRELSTADATTPARTHVRDILIIDREDLPAAMALSKTVAAEGIKSRYVTQPGFVDMLMMPPYYARTSPGITDELCDWIRQRVLEEPAEDGPFHRFRIGSAAASAQVFGAPFDPSGVFRAPLTEQAVTLGAEPRLFGIMTLPDAKEPRRRAVILLNDGATHHIGASRLNVSLARRWARRGYHVLRMDLAGLGDSGTRVGELPNQVFPRHALDDIRAALEFVRDQYGCRDVTLGGLCSGAYHSLRAAAADLAVDRILMINPENFFWSEGSTLEDLQVAEVVRNPSLYRNRLLSRRYWQRVLAGEVDLWRVTRIFLRRGWLGIESVLRDAARALHIRVPRDLGRELEEIAQRGIRIVFVFASGEAGIDLLKIQAGRSLRRLGDRCRVHIVEGADHVFSKSSSRLRLEGILSEELFAPARLQRRAKSATRPSSR